MMKRIAITFIAAVSFNAALMAQTVLDGIVIYDGELNRNDQMMTASMDLDLSEFNLSANEAVLLTPVIKKDTLSHPLPPLGFYGRNRYYYYVRNSRNMTDGGNEAVYRDSEMPEHLPYVTNVPFEDWMQGAHLVLEKKVYGCCGKIIDENFCMLDRYLIYTPEYVYIKPPKVNKKKARFVEGVAYVDYPVSKTAIYPDYHNNKAELAKIENVIDSVKLDNDITITSIYIKGFASPESPYKNNARLAQGRTEAIKKYVLDLYDMPDKLIATDYEPENWEGLREYLVASDLQHKDEIIEIIDREEEPDRKEWLIKSRFADDYRFLLNNCYPYLRRTNYRIEYEIHSFTDVEHIKELVKTRPQKLNLEEFYLAAENIEPESPDFQEVFDVAVRMYPEDKIANLNAANVAMQRKDFKSAENFIARASDSPEAIYARGVCAALQGNYTEARKHFEAAADLGIEEAGAALDTILQLLGK